MHQSFQLKEDCESNKTTNSFSTMLNFKGYWQSLQVPANMIFNSKFFWRQRSKSDCHTTVLVSQDKPFNSPTNKPFQTGFEQTFELPGRKEQLYKTNVFEICVSLLALKVVRPFWGVTAVRNYSHLLAIQTRSQDKSKYSRC